jgi:hypothetical protein
MLRKKNLIHKDQVKRLISITIHIAVTKAKQAKIFHRRSPTRTQGMLMERKGLQLPGVTFRNLDSVHGRNTCWGKGQIFQ